MSGFAAGMRRSGNGLLVRVSLIAAIGGLLFGYGTGAISGALLYIKTDLHAGKSAQQAIVSALLLGACSARFCPATSPTRSAADGPRCWPGRCMSSARWAAPSL